MIRFFLCVLLGVSMTITFACSPAENNNNNDTEKGSSKDAGTTDDKTAGGCTLSSECKCSETCQGGTCEKITCSTSSDCRCSWVCVTGSCYDPKNAPCTKDDDCTADPKLWKCNTASGKCEDGGCRTDSDCKDAKLPSCNTTSNQCETKKCTDNSDCFDATKPICDTTSGDCGADKGVDLGGECSSSKPCKLKLACYADGGKSSCHKPCTPFGSPSQCDKTKVCIRVTGVAKVDGLCVETGSGVDESNDCADNKSCKRHLTCAYTGKGETCQRGCVDDSSCENQETCQSYGDAASKTKLCMPKASPCGPGRACPGENEGYHICSNGQCQVLTCPNQRSCPPTHTCTKSGRCVPIECPKAKCPDLYECKNNRCSETNEGKSCGQGTNIGLKDCGTGLICEQVGYVSSCVRPCDTAKPCPSDMECQTNRNNKKICIQKCAAPKPCKYKAYACITLKRNPAGNYCVPAGQPTGGDEFEVCDTSNACLPDFTCFRGFSAAKGYCVRRCTSQNDCNGTSVTSICYSYSSVRGCFAKCTSSSSSSCSLTLTGVRFYCTYGGGSGKYFCRPR